MKSEEAVQKSAANKRGFGVALTLEKIETRLNTNLSLRDSDKLLYKLKLILQESIHNVQEHAYQDIDGKMYVGLYVRYRTGGTSISETIRKARLKEQIKQELIRCPKLDIEWLLNKDGGVELFVVDRGIGVIKSFQRAGQHQGKKLRLQNLIIETYKSGASSKTERISSKGGLNLINEVSGGDYLRVFCEDTWIGSSLPIARQERQFHFKDSKISVRGFASHFRLSWKNITDKGDKWYPLGQSNEEHKRELGRILAIDYDEVISIIDSHNYAIVDERFHDNDVKVNKTLAHIEENGILLWLVKPGRMKWDIFSYIERSLYPNIVGKTIRLVVGNIDSHEASTYEAAFVGSRFRQNQVPWATSISNIILVSQRWLFAKLNRTIQEYPFDTLDEKITQKDIQYSSIKSEDIDLEGAMGTQKITLRKLIIHIIKHHESVVFWSLLSNRHEKNLFVDYRVEWSKNIYLEKGYLNFSNISRIPVIRDLLVKALERYLAAVTLIPDDYMYAALDRLVNTIVEELKSSKNDDNLNADYSDNKKIGIGSVFVSGETQSYSEPNSSFVYFFKHPDSPPSNNDIAHLFHWKKNIKQINEKPVFKRVGSTSAIAQHGWMSVSIPRVEGTKVVGYRTPEETYQDIQSLAPLISKTGHWNYEGHHDLVTFNLHDSIEDAFAQNNDLFYFLTGYLLSYVGVDFSNDVLQDYTTLFARAIKDKKLPQFPNQGIVLYRSHLISEKVIAGVLSVLKENKRKKYEPLFIPLLPLRKKWSGSAFIISPMDKAHIRDTFFNQPENRKNALIFDDASITGRTLMDLSSISKSLSAESIDSCVILDRMRLPSTLNVTDHYNYYWRVDIPLMGKDGSCPMCHAIDLLSAFKQKLCCKENIAYVEDWVEFWRTSSPISNWNKGLKPLPLNDLKYEKKYCFDEKSQEPLSSVHIKRSVGLITHVTELHSMTGADKYVLDRIEKFELDKKTPDEPVEVKVELICSQILLFGSEFEYQHIKRFLELLIKYLNLLPATSPYAGLAIIGFINGLDTVSLSSKKHVVEEVFRPLNTNNEFVLNESLTLLTTFLITQEFLEEQNYLSASQLLKADGLEFPLLLRELHSSILSEQGNKHSRPLTRFISDLKCSSVDINSESFARSKISVTSHLYRIKSVIESIRISKSRTLHGRNINTSNHNLIKLLDEVIDNLGATTKFDGGIVIELLDRLIEELIEYSAFYVHVVHTSKPNPLGDIVASLKKMIEEISNLGIEKSIGLRRMPQKSSNNINQHCWIVWTVDIQRITYDLMTNACHVEQTKDDKHLWCSYYLTENGLSLELENILSANEKPESIFTAVTEQKRWADLENLGGTITLAPDNSGDENTFCVKLTIPFVHRLTFKGN